MQPETCSFSYVYKYHNKSSDKSTLTAQSYPRMGCQGQAITIVEEPFAVVKWLLTDCAWQCSPAGQGEGGIGGGKSSANGACWIIPCLFVAFSTPFISSDLHQLQSWQRSEESTFTVSLLHCGARELIPLSPLKLPNLPSPTPDTAWSY